MTIEVYTLAALLLHEAGKAGTHALRDQAWARRPLVEGLPITDAYHALSGAQWPAMALLAWCGFGLAWGWWLAAVAAFGLLWPISKLGKGLTLREGLAECWYIQIFQWFRGAG